MGDGEHQQALVDNNNKGKRPPPLTRTASFYPGREASTEPVLTHLPSRVQLEKDVHDGDTDVEREEDWFTDLPPAEPAGKTSARVLEAMLVERPIWQSTPSSMGSATGNIGSVTAGDDVATSQEGSGGSDAPVDPVVAPEPSQQPWPAETDLLYPPGSNKVMLTIQRPLMRAVFQEAFERIRGAMMFKNAFPGVYEAIEMITDNLILAAESIDRAASIHIRLLMDGDYTSNMSRIPRARIPIFRGEVKDRCVAIIQSEFLALRSKSSVIQLVEKQLSNYNYTFPRSSNDDLLSYLPRRTRPYRNIRIINVIRDLYFSGGTNSFVNRFRMEFPVHQGSDGVVLREVPVPMVALVATALYAAIQEWRTGVQKNIEFSANAFLDVYNGHINTFNHIRNNREGAFHTMMTDIYTRASSAAIEPSANLIAEIDLDDLDG